MAIKFKCTCGHVLSVPDNFAGKSGKCPKCQKALKVPQPSAGKTQAAAKPAAGGGPVAARPATGGKLDSLFDDVGLVQKAGPICSSCGADIKPGTVVCTSCGFNLETGQRLAGFEAERVGPEFDNLYLQEAADNMKRDTIMESRRDKAALPWWVLMSFLIGAMTLCAAGVIIIDGRFGEPAPTTTFIGRLQALPVSIVLGVTAGITGLAITVFAHLSICLFAFGKNAWHGVACFFLPLIFSVVYGIMNWTDNKAPVKAIMTAIVFIGIAVGLIVQGGGFGYLTKLI